MTPVNPFSYHRVNSNDSVPAPRSPSPPPTGVRWEHYADADRWIVACKEKWRDKSQRPVDLSEWIRANQPAVAFTDDELRAIEETLTGYLQALRIFSP